MVRRETLADEQPSSITELQPLVEDFLKRLKNIDNEIKLLSDDKKKLLEEFSDRLDVKTLKAATKAVEVREKASDKDAFDSFVVVLEKL